MQACSLRYQLQVRAVSTAIIILGAVVRTERPLGQSFLETALQVDLSFDSKGHYLNHTAFHDSGAHNLTHSASSMTKNFEDLLCFALNGKKFYYRPRPSVMITLDVGCTIHYAGREPVRTVQLDFEEGIVEDEDQPPTIVVKVQYGTYLQGAAGNVEGLAGNENAWVIGGREGIAYQTWTEQAGDVAFFNEDFRKKPPSIWLCGTLVTSTKERLFGKKKISTETADFGSVNNIVARQGRLWFATKLLPEKSEQERGVVIAGLQAENSAATAGVEDLKQQHHVIKQGTRERGSKTKLGKCGNLQGVASCLDSVYVCKITKIEYDASAHTVVLSFVSSGDGSDGYLHEGKDPKKSMLYWEGDGGSAKPTAVQNSEYDMQGKIVGRMTFKDIPRNAKSVQFRYGSSNCCKQHTQSYSKADIDLNSASLRICQPTLLYLMIACASSAATIAAWNT